MKLSHVTLGLLILGASAGIAQDGRRRTASDSTKVDKHRPVDKHKAKHDTVKATTKPVKITKDYCPPCGMG
jgi:hypothetical protein